MEKTIPYNNLDAIKELSAYDKAVENARKHLRGEAPLDEDLEDSYVGDFDDSANHPQVILDDAGNVIVKHKWSKLGEDKNSPEVGDVIWLPIKLTQPKEGKYIWNGYERRPVFVIEVHGDKVNVLEITHSPKYEGLSLIPLPSMSSHVNVYNYWKDCYRDREVTYEFPYRFNPDGTPQTFEQCFGGLSSTKKNKKDTSSEPYIVEHTYSDNFDKHVSDQELEKVKKQYEQFKHDVEKSDD